MKCDICNGNGTLTYNPNHSIKKLTIPCTNCNGTGEIIYKSFSEAVNAEIKQMTKDLLSLR